MRSTIRESDFRKSEEKPVSEALTSFTSLAGPARQVLTNSRCLFACEEGLFPVSLDAPLPRLSRPGRNLIVVTSAVAGDSMGGEYYFCPWSSNDCQPHC
jgi:hypothetical protein